MKTFVIIYHKKKMAYNFIKVLTLTYSLVTYVLATGLNNTILYQAPDECRWSGLNDVDIVLVCHLRTINSELENTNFSVIQPQNTIRLRLECNEALFFQSSLSPGSFKNLIELRSLTIEFCKLGNLTEGSFEGLQYLKNLTIRTHNSDWSSMSLDIANNVFNDFRQLEYLDLTKNNIWTIPDGMICPLKTLKFLNVSNNKIQDINSFHFSASLNTRKSRICGTSLNTLDLSKNKISNLPSAIFSGLNRLQILNLTQNEINFIADRAFAGLVSLTVVDLSKNKLKNLPPELFSEAKYVKEIHLHNNGMNVLAPGIFSSLIELVILDLSNNDLNSQWITTDTFVGLKKLKILDLSKNNIHNLEPTLFKILKNLEVLKLQENFIDYIPEGVFSELTNLNTLILSNNRITDIDSLTFRGLYEILVLSLDNNKISNINLLSFKNCSRLQDLHINGNKLTTVPNALQFVPLLKTLDLGENLISNIENSSLINLENLYGLRLTENLISLIKKGIFDKMQQLQILNLSKNKIINIEKGTFDKNLQIQAIRIDGNFLKSISGLFTNLPNLVWLNISDNHLEKFDYSHIPVKLQWLDVHSNRIYHLSNYLEIESELLLNTFDISSNSLTEITTTSIPNSVVLLYLNDNLLTKIQPYTFFKKTNLSRVDLFGNKLTSLEPNAFRLSPISHGIALPEFYIGGNPFKCDCNLDWIKKTNSETRTQPKLMDLATIFCRLSYNRENMYLPLIATKSSDFLCKYEIHCFALCHCCDFNACDCKMECPNNCKCYHDQSWTSNIVDCSKASYKNILPKHIPMDSTQIHLDGNHFPNLDSHTFIGRKRLKILYLNNSYIETIMNRTFYGLLELEVLQLDHNNLIKLIGNEFQGLENLKELFLNYNKITSINNYTFTYLRNLKTLRLDHNSIIEFSGLSFLPPYIIDLQLSSNPLRCDCAMISTFRNFTKYGTITKDLSNIMCTISYNSSKYEMTKNNTILSIENLVFYKKNHSNLCQDLEESNIINENFDKQLISLNTVKGYSSSFVLIFSIFLISIIFSVILFIYRQEVRVWFHSRFGIRIFYNASQDVDKNETDKIFDAFISYSSRDESFVMDELVQVLENSDPYYKLCLHYRDYPDGENIADNIVQAIDSSRRTIMVISKNFIKSEWCRFEFKSAHHQIFRDRKRRLIIILLGELPQKDLDPDIRLYLKTNTCLQWNDKLFWEKLRFALPEVDNNQRQINSNLPLTNTAHQVQYFSNLNTRENNNHNSNQIMLTDNSNILTPRTVAIHI